MYWKMPRQMTVTATARPIGLALDAARWSLVRCSQRTALGSWLGCSASSVAPRNSRGIVFNSFRMMSRSFSVSQTTKAQELEVRPLISSTSKSSSRPSTLPRRSVDVEVFWRWMNAFFPSPRPCPALLLRFFGTLLRRPLERNFWVVWCRKRASTARNAARSTERQPSTALASATASGCGNSRGVRDGLAAGSGLRAPCSTSVHTSMPSSCNANSWPAVTLLPSTGASSRPYSA
mmetsp:Transcript_132171/g.368437  ORF Transcript_132171/g.368437 Transcript_132171/m.368437 type:complete len:234 (+) Transcript_132171:678-1379(+)